MNQFNISEKFKFQWIAPERTGSRKVAEVLSFFGFNNDGVPVYSFNNYSYTHQVQFSEKYKDYQIICNARNPYAKTLGICRSVVGLEYIKADKETFKKFVFKELRRGNRLDMVQRPLMDKKIDYIVRLENISEDLKKIPFISEKFTSEQIESLVTHGKAPLNWEEFYDQETKDAVYSYTSHLFEMWGYEK